MHRLEDLKSTGRVLPRVAQEYHRQGHSARVTLGEGIGTLTPTSPPPAYLREIGLGPCCMLHVIRQVSCRAGLTRVTRRWTGDSDDPAKLLLQPPNHAERDSSS